MDEFQATPPAELLRLRLLSAQLYADLILQQAARLLYDHAGSAALQELRGRIQSSLRETPDHEPADDRPVRLAFEELERVLQIAEKGGSSLRGWAVDAAPSVEERR